MKKVLREFRKKLHTHPHITFLETCREAQEKTASQNVERRDPFFNTLVHGNALPVRMLWHGGYNIRKHTPVDQGNNLSGTRSLRINDGIPQTRTKSKPLGTNKKNFRRGTNDRSNGDVPNK